MSLRTKLIALVALLACAALAGPQPAAAAKKKTRVVDATLKAAVIESSSNANQFVNHFAGWATGTPGGTKAVVGTDTITVTATGLIIEGRARVYGKKGTYRLKTLDEGLFQPDGSLVIEGNFEVPGGTGRYKGATGNGTLNSVIPPGTPMGVGAMITVEVDGKLRF